MDSNKKNIKQAAKLKGDVEKLLWNWDERSQFVIKGVGNLSRADLDSLTMVCDEILRLGFSRSVFYGGTKEVLDAYGINLI